jgi:hypothetical protein
MIKVKVTARLYEYEDLKGMLKPDHGIVILSCNSCARLNDGLGGEEGAENLARKLRADGFDVVHRELLNEACSPDEFKGNLKDEGVEKLFEGADVLIPLSCSAGIERVQQVLPELRILHVTKTLGLGTYSPETGVRLTEPEPGIHIEIDDRDGIELPEAAARLGLYSGSF